MKILTAAEMAAVDRRAIEEIGVPGMVLMENAALGVVDALAELFPGARRVAVLCGPGNNGGDGLAVARHLDLRGYDLRVFLLVPGSSLRGDAATQLQILERQGPHVDEATDDDGIDQVLAACVEADIVVDALFGTGLSRPLAGRFARLALGLPALRAEILAVDIPSGLDGSTGTPPGPHVVADATVTFAAPKRAHVFPPASDAVGRLVVADLGIARHLVDEAPGSLHLLTADWVAACLLPRPTDGHKGTFGHALVVGGSVGKSGAVVLAARAALRSGAGLVTAAVPTDLISIVDAASTESMTLDLPDGAQGATFDPAQVDAILEFASGVEALALGPGLGRAPATVDAVQRLVAASTVPLVLDADGLHAVAGRLELLRDRLAPTVLTPHPGETARLLGIDAAAVQSDRLGAAERLAKETRAVVVLKGHRTLVADGTGTGDTLEIWVNPTGNPGMATGGTGDVLTGIVAALLAQGLDALPAACVGAFVHGAAGDLAAESTGETGLVAGDVVEALSRAWTSLPGSSR